MTAMMTEFWTIKCKLYILSNLFNNICGMRDLKGLTKNKGGGRGKVMLSKVMFKPRWKVWFILTPNRF